MLEKRQAASSTMYVERNYDDFVRCLGLLNILLMLNDVNKNAAVGVAADIQRRKVALHILYNKQIATTDHSSRENLELQA